MPGGRRRSLTRSFNDTVEGSASWKGAAMSTASVAAALREIARQLDDPPGPVRASDELLAGRTEQPTLLALGEPTHGIKEFPLLRNELLAHLVDRGYRSIVLETDFFAASVVDDYVAGGAADLDTVLATAVRH